MRRAALTLAAALALAAPPAASGQYAVPPGTPPLICRDDVFVDIVGTDQPDRLAAFDRATRVWGLQGADVLTGSANRASCLLGGRGNDILALNSGGGVVYGGRGRDTIYGSNRGDVLNGGADIDGVVAAGGDDKIDTRDGQPELVDCGAGDDIARADRVDVLVGCELLNVAGPAAPRLAAQPARTHTAGTVRVRMTIPRAAGAGAYRFIYVTGAGDRRCGGGPVEVARFPAPGARVRRGQKVKVGARRPPLGWCAGTARVAVVRDPGYNLPLVAVARFAFTVR